MRKDRKTERGCETHTQRKREIARKKDRKTEKVVNENPRKDSGALYL